MSILQKIRRFKVAGFIVLFAVCGTVVLVRGFAGIVLTAKVSEAETFAGAQNTSVLTDVSASGGSYLHFDASVSDGSYVQPTRANTGPRFSLDNLSVDAFYASRTCNKQRISGDLRFDQASMKGQLFTLKDCEITGNVWLYINGGGSPLPLSEMPIISMDYVDILGGIIALNAMKLTVDHSYIGGSQLGVKDYWAPFISAPAPYFFKNSMFYGAYASQPTHTEALHVGDYGSGYQFINVAFVQGSGPLANSGVTATINFHGSDALFDNCWFIWEGEEVPAYFAAYLDGINTVVKNSKFSAGASGYIYGASANNPVFSSNSDYLTGATVLSP